jgi:N-acetylglucosaminyldiphosphoundecaprenol N-acetyl-beta-D-mannosaminyltransferase
MQKTGLEWLYRLLQEPRRLFKRYATDFAVFGITIMKQWWLTRGGKRSASATTTPEIPTQRNVPDVQLSSVAELFSPERLDAAEVRTIEQAWMKSLEGQEEGVIIDCGGAQFIDSTGLGLLMRMQKRCRQSGKHLVLASVSPAVFKLLQMTRLNSIFTQAASREEALSKILNAGVPAASSGSRVAPLQLTWSGAVTSNGVEGLWRGALGVLQNAADARNPVVIDLQGVQLMDSGGLGLMARLKDHATSHHIHLRFANASPVVHESLRHEQMEYLLAS